MDMAAGIAALETQVAPETRAKLRASAKEYEAVFVSQMMGIMFQNVDFNPMGAENSTAGDTYKSMLMDQYGKSIARQGNGIGLSDPLYKSLLQTQIAAQEVNNK